MISFNIMLFMPSSFAAADCFNPPRGFGGSWARAYKQWCESCCGTYSPVGPSCSPGSNWGCGGSGGGSSNYDNEAERQRQQEMERQRQLRIEEEKRRAEEEKVRMKEEFERNKREALQSMKGVSDKELGLKGGSSGNLGLKDIPGDNLGLKDAGSYDTDNLNRKRNAVKIKADKETQKAPSFQKGLSDASQCYGPNGKVYCLSSPATEQKKCEETYTAGFNSGMEHQKILLDGAYTYGKRDKEDGKKNLSFNHPEAKGPCRVKWIQSYNRGYFAGKTSAKTDLK